jgi:hypothetical protein
MVEYVARAELGLAACGPRGAIDDIRSATCALPPIRQLHLQQPWCRDRPRALLLLTPMARTPLITRAAGSWCRSANRTARSPERSSSATTQLPSAADQRRELWMDSHNGFDCFWRIADRCLTRRQSASRRS